MVVSLFGRLLKPIAFETVSIHRRLFGQIANETHPHVLEKGQVTPGISKTEYLNRRCNLMNNILQENPSKKVVALVPSAGVSYMAPDVPYPFRQNSNFLYLCGFQEPDSVLLMTNIGCNNNFKSLLFVPKRDEKQELWNGPRTGSERAVDLTGCDEAYNVDDLESILSSLVKKVKLVDLWHDEYNSFHCSSYQKYLNFCKNESNIKNSKPTKDKIYDLRFIKSNSEIELMKKACGIGSKCLKDVMGFSRPEVDENHLQAKMDFECRLRGAWGLAYPPVVAGGNRANTIHYINNNQIIRDGEMVLMDAGCDYHGYCSDITRTWPINGEFSPVQKELYEALLEVQKICIDLCVANDFSLHDIYEVMIQLLGRQLQRLSLIDKNVNTKDLAEATKAYCPHHIGHYLGMDVHDTDGMSTFKKLMPGMIITIEPGIYIPKDHKFAPKQYRGIGMRIEDNILITDQQPFNLTQNCPKEIKDIEKVMNGSSC